MAIEKPQYQVLLKDKRFELRRYDPYITADVDVSARDRVEAANEGFRVLAGFIFGKNTVRQKIEMTAPVTAASRSEKIAMTAPVTISGNGKAIVSFSMPRKYSRDSLPQPLDKRIYFSDHEESLVATVRFSGSFNERNFHKFEAQLLDWMKNKKLVPSGSPVVAGYDPPFTPWFIKHNELLIHCVEKT